MADKPEELNDKLKNVYNTDTVEAQRELYRGWAETSDHQTSTEFGYVGYETAAAEFANRVTGLSTRILDAGCGTGLTGMSLAKHGYSNIHGLDLSPEMLAIARKLNVYQSLDEADLTKPLKVEELFDAIFSVGLFGYGPPHPEHIHHLINALKPGGLAVISVNGKGWEERNWDDHLQTEIDEHSLMVKERVEVPFLEKENIKGIVLVFEGRA